MNDSERKRRAVANAHRDEIDSQYAIPVKPKELGHIMSIRLPGPVAIRLKDHANRKGESVSDIVRRAVLEMLNEPSIGFRCAHVAIVSAPGVLRSASANCGCAMRKVFDLAELAGRAS